ncbi:MAG: aminoacetone oxidase family FAD-binding enzyme [Eubacterium sp.]|nr:aminoacetone oxidase family FAD-binding enzyme [Eubacterium sp.]
MREYSEAVIVGAGASGLVCGGILAEAGISVVILEKNNRIGKKLSATGNGRCNFTNLNMDVSHYYGDKEWIEQVLTRKSPQEIVTFFQNIGVFFREKEGYVYPHTNQASTVVEAFGNFCRNCEIITECRVTALRKEKDGKFRIRTTQGTIQCRYVIMATGGKAGEELGGDGNGYRLARSMGHRVQPIYPGLPGLIWGGDWWKQVAGTRIQGRFSLIINGKKIPGEAGEIQVTKEGVSGIPVFQLCRVAAEALAKWEGEGVVFGEIDFVPELGKIEVEQWVERFGIAGLVPKKWVPVLEKKGAENAVLKQFQFPVLATYGIERAQVTAGGVPTSEVMSETMESKLVSGLYFTGELLDVDGRCGGYNLHFAWSTAMIAAEAIIRERN